MSKYERMLIRMRNKFIDLSSKTNDETLRDSIVLIADLCDILSSKQTIPKGVKEIKSSQDVLIPVVTYPQASEKHYEISKLLKGGYELDYTGFMQHYDKGCLILHFYNSSKQGGIE